LISKVVAMFGLQRLAQDSNYAVARAASQAIDELKKQWELEEGDSLRFVMNQNLASEETDDGSSAADDIMWAIRVMRPYKSARDGMEGKKNQGPPIRNELASAIFSCQT
jgi:hypothetical protein